MNFSANNASIATTPRHEASSPTATAAASTSLSAKPNQDLKLQVATQYCAKGRSSWAAGDHTEALTQFRHALLILETILGAQHILVAQLYHWMGLIFYEQTEYRKAEQCFIRYLRIRYALNHVNDSNSAAAAHKTLPSDTNTLEAQTSLSNLWQEQGISSNKAFDMIQQLQESVQLELEGDALLMFHDSKGGSGSDDKRLQQTQASNYILAMKTYQQAMNIFPDAHHDTIMRKLAMCYHKARGNGVKGMVDPSSLASNSNNHPNYFLDQAVVWYRMALKVFCTSYRFSETTMEPSGVHQNLVTSHPEYQNIQKNLEDVLSDYHSLDFGKIKQYVGQGGVRKSVLHQFAAEEAMSAATKSTDKTASVDDVAQARREYHEALKIEKSIFQRSNDNTNAHLVVLNLQKELSQLDENYVARLEEERVLSMERLGLLEHQSTDWVATVRHQEEQLQKLQSSLENRAGHAAEALNAAASKEAEMVGWKRKFETMQTEWKASKARILSLESEKALLQQQLKQTESKIGQLEFTFKKQDLDFQNFQDTTDRKSREADGWKEQYQAALQAQQHAQQKCERSEATERELRAQIKDLQSQNLVLKDWNKEHQSEQQVNSRSIAASQPVQQLASQSVNDSLQQLEQKDHDIRALQTKLQEVTHTKDRAIKKLKKYHAKRQEQQ
ncbi:MAG: hypothetical protein SGILL_005831, partial [Bacillariaceae sp.]